TYGSAPTWTGRVGWSAYWRCDRRAFDRASAGQLDDCDAVAAPTGLRCRVSLHQRMLREHLPHRAAECPCPLAVDDPQLAHARAGRLVEALIDEQERFVHRQATQIEFGRNRRHGQP